MIFFKPRGFVLFVVSALLSGGSCSRHAGLPDVESKQYRELCSVFYTGLAGLQSGDDARAQENLARAAKIAPGEPAAWADLSILQLRQQDQDAAFGNAQTAKSLAPDNSRIEALLGLIESRRGNVNEALAHLRKAISLDGRNLKALYSLADETERQGLTGSEANAEQILGQILLLQPNNAAVLLDIARLAAKTGDAAELKKMVDTLRPQAGAWSDRAREQFAKVQQQASGDNPHAAALQVQFLRNVLLREPAYRQSLEQVKVPSAFVAEPFVRFLRLPAPSSKPAPPDTALQFASQPLAGTDKSAVSWVGAIALNAENKPAVLWADGDGLHVPGAAPLPLPKRPQGKNAIVGADLNYDFKTDLIAATPGGIKIYQQIDPQHFQEVTAETKLPAAIINGSYTGAWPFDIDLDGDLDIVLGVPGGEPVVLRNNGDGTYASIEPFHGVKGLTAFSAADINGDGTPDVALIDGDGKLRVFKNERLGHYREREIPPALAGRYIDIAAADMNSDGLLDFAALRSDMAVFRLSGKDAGAGWDFGQLISPHSASSNVNLSVADLDNNGALDLIVGDQVFLSDGGTLAPLPAKLSGNAWAVADLNSDGRVDVISPTFEMLNHGTKNYHWQIIRAKAAHATGDQRVNSFGIGGEIEIRSGLLTQKQLINGPILHFGLGEQNSVDLARIVWPNGSVQAEFALKPDTTVLAEQRLKGSCPFLFTWDGQRMRFVKDTAPWSPALGLHINAQQVAGIYQTQEWFKIPGDSLAPHDGIYDLRVTAEYWETFYIDHYSLLVVDHPRGTQIYSDERFAVPPPPLKLYVTKDPQPFAGAKDDTGRDVSDIVGRLDGNYLDTFGRGRYQGVTRGHWVELELPQSAPRNAPLYLIGHGWMHPTDATTNVALAQSSDPPPQGLSIEVEDKNGQWVTARSGLGFPAGRFKTVVFQLPPDRKFRLRTNLEIYWDKLEWAEGAGGAEVKTKHPELASADLQYRGFSQITQANLSSPEVPSYNVLAGTGQKWRDMRGYFTRFGDVRELLDKIDDRMVIMNAGDELRLKFSAQPPVRDGWLRDYIMVGDGWIKDGDYNSTFSNTVLPLPYHGMKDYSVAPSALEEDPAYRLHPGDWQLFHTRYVTPKEFLTELWGRK